MESQELQDRSSSHMPALIEAELTSPNRANADGTHDGEERRERNRNGEVH